MQNTTGKKSKKKQKNKVQSTNKNTAPLIPLGTSAIWWMQHHFVLTSMLLHISRGANQRRSVMTVWYSSRSDCIYFIIFCPQFSYIYFGWVGYIVNCFIICLIQVFWPCCAVDLRRMFHIEASCVFALCGSPVWLPVLLKLLSSAWNSCGPLLSKIDLARINRGAEALLGCCW